MINSYDTTTKDKFLIMFDSDDIVDESGTHMQWLRAKFNKNQCQIHSLWECVDFDSSQKKFNLYGVATIPQLDGLGVTTQKLMDNKSSEAPRLYCIINHDDKDNESKDGFLENHNAYFVFDDREVLVEDFLNKTRDTI